MKKLLLGLLGLLLHVCLFAQSDPFHGVCTPGCHYEGIYTADFRSSDTYVMKVNVGTLIGNITYISGVPLDVSYWTHDGTNLCLYLVLTDYTKHRLELLGIRRITITVGTDKRPSWPEDVYEFYHIDCDVLF